MFFENLLPFISAFLVGGVICTLAQILINYTKLTAGKILVVFLLLGVFLQSIGVYQYLVDFGGAGATVPISGFGYLLAKGAIEGAKISLFKAVTGGIVAAGMGITAAIVFGYIFSLIFKSKSKKN
jgi:stage V sporulation protein AE